ncbi:MAG: hypothetical protein HUU20_02250 [Pirellulales bacterium]|nr:hypothetical protein [Pirellulales bacterium]
MSHGFSRRASRRLLEAVLPGLFAVLCSARACAEPQPVVNAFNSDAEGWQVYDFAGGVPGGNKIFAQVTWEKAGGVGNSGYIWGDDSRWRINLPETPDSILAFVFYRKWAGAPELDLRDAEVSVYLRGDKLDLKGAKCYFWVSDTQTVTRWHYTAHPLPVPEGHWGEKQTFVLKNDEALWHSSWSGEPQNVGSLDAVLGGVDSYGLAFVGFTQKVTGRFAMDELQVRLRPRPERGAGRVQPTVAAIGSSRRFWFNSQDLIEKQLIVRLLQNQLVKHPQNPLMVADKPWEGTLVQLYSCDIHHDSDSGKWQMWYEGHPAEVLMCTAFSNDGLRWTKPSLDLQSWQGSRDNNIILQTHYWDAHCASIVKAPTEKDPEKRYKLYYWVAPTWYNPKIPPHAEVGFHITDYRASAHYVAFSSDGIRFTPKTDRPAIVGSDFATVLFDPRKGCYRAYVKEMRGGRRAMSLRESGDGINFGEMVPVLDADKTDDVSVQRRGYNNAEIYGMHVWPVGDFYLGIVWLYCCSGTPGTLLGKIEPYLMYGPDGIAWKRLPVREPLIASGPAGSFDSANIYTTGNGPILKEDQLFFYYHGTGVVHGQDYEPDVQEQLREEAKQAGIPFRLKANHRRYAGVGLATLPRDRYVGWCGGTVPGLLTTRPFTFTGKQLFLNVDASRGETRVAILDQDGKPLPGFAADDCVAVSADSLDQVVGWTGNCDLSSLAGKAVRLQFHLRHSVLYTWQFRDEQK